jgi:hypothetical protein
VELDLHHPLLERNWIRGLVEACVCFVFARHLLGVRVGESRRGYRKS